MREAQTQGSGQGKELFLLGNCMCMCVFVCIGGGSMGAMGGFRPQTLKIMEALPP